MRPSGWSCRGRSHDRLRGVVREYYAQSGDFLAARRHHRHRPGARQFSVVSDVCFLTRFPPPARVPAHRLLVADIGASRKRDRDLRQAASRRRIADRHRTYRGVAGYSRRRRRRKNAEEPLAGHFRDGLPDATNSLTLTSNDVAQALLVWPMAADTLTAGFFTGHHEGNGRAPNATLQRLNADDGEQTTVV